MMPVTMFRNYKKRGKMYEQTTCYPCELKANKERKLRRKNG